MPKFARECAKQIKKQKLTLSDDYVDIAPQEVEHDHIPDEMPDVTVEQWRGKKLPGVSL